MPNPSRESRSAHLERILLSCPPAPLTIPSSPLYRIISIEAHDPVGKMKLWMTGLATYADTVFAYCPRHQHLRIHSSRFQCALTPCSRLVEPSFCLLVHHLVMKNRL